MAKKWSGTTLVDPEFKGDDINKALLDLLQKVNDTYQQGLTLAQTVTDNFALASTVLKASRLQANSLSLVTSVATDITSIVIPAGTWDLSGAFALTSTSAIFTGIRFVINETSGALVGATGNPPSATGVISLRPQFVASSVFSNIQTYPMPTYRVTYASQQTLYMTVQAVFTSGPPEAFGWIEARRVPV